MLDRVLPPNSPTRRRLRFLARRFNVAVSRRLRENFTQPTPEGQQELEAFLRNTYFPASYKDIDLDGFYDSAQGRAALDNHLFFRLELDRYELAPWIDSVVQLSGATVLEIGCGTGPRRSRWRNRGPG